MEKDVTFNCEHMETFLEIRRLGFCFYQPTLFGKLKK
jgi:hypothetical protein